MPVQVRVQLCDCFKSGFSAPCLRSANLSSISQEHCRRALMCHFSHQSGHHGNLLATLLCQRTQQHRVAQSSHCLVSNSLPAACLIPLSLLETALSRTFHMRQHIQIVLDQPGLPHSCCHMQRQMPLLSCKKFYVLKMHQGWQLQTRSSQKVLHQFSSLAVVL